jgi:hypothetical protein
MGKLKQTKNYAVLGVPMTQQEFELMVQEADKGPFHSIEKVKQAIDKWKLKNAK